MILRRSFELNYWPSIADMVLAVSMIFLLLWFVERFRVLELMQSNAALQQEIDSLRRDKPPIITLDEASGYTFDSGSASLSTSFTLALQREIIPKLENVLKEYNVDVIEVIGHTDGQTVSTKQSNLDIELENVVLEKSTIDALIFGSNVDLGLIRAIAVAKYIKGHANGKLQSVHYRFYSAAQLIPQTGDLQSVNREPETKRRRIELRFTRLSK